MHPKLLAWDKGRLDATSLQEIGSPDIFGILEAKGFSLRAEVKQFIEL